MSEHVKDKINIDVYFADFETADAAPAAAIAKETSLLSWNVLPQSTGLPEITFARHPYKKALNETELDDATYELKQLRWQIVDGFGITATSQPSLQPQVRQRWRPLLLILLVSGLSYGSFNAFRYCQNTSACDRVNQAVGRFSQLAIAQIDTWRAAIASRNMVALGFRPLKITAESLPQPQTLEITDPAFRAGLHEANQAAILTQTAVQTEEWEQVAYHWEQAIAHLENVADDSGFKSIAQQKIDTYYGNLDYAYSEFDTFREAVNAAMQAATMTQTATTQADWQDVAQTWTVAISLMKSVTPESPYHFFAQFKIDEYTHNLVYAETAAMSVSRNQDTVTATEPQPDDELSSRR